MRFVDDGVLPWDVGAEDLAAPPVEGLVDYDRLWHPARVVAAVERQVFPRAAGAIGKMRVAPHQPAGEAPRVGVEQQLVGIEAMALLRRVGAVHAVTVELPGRNVVEIAVPDVLGAFGKLDFFQFAAALAVEQAQLDLLRIRREQRKVRAPAVPACAEPGRRAGRQSHAQPSGTRKIAANGGMVRLSSGTKPSRVLTSPTLPTLPPP